MFSRTQAAPRRLNTAARLRPFLALIWAVVGTVAQPVLAQVPVIKHYPGTRLELATSIAVTCPDSGLFSVALTQLAGTRPKVADLVSHGHRLPPTETTKLNGWLGEAAALDHVSMGCASTHQVILLISCTRRAGESIEPFTIVVFMDDRAVQRAPDQR